MKMLEKLKLLTEWWKLSVLVIGALVTVVGFGFSSWQEHTELVESVQNHEQRIQQVEKAVTQGLGELLNEIKKISKQAMTMGGFATISDAGRDQAYVQVNTLGRASAYTEGHKKLRVTNLSSEQQSSHDFPVNGTFQATDENILIRLSRLAADRLEANGKPKVRIEPVRELPQ